jgi:hypothetical protein
VERGVSEDGTKHQADSSSTWRAERPLKLVAVAAVAATIAAGAMAETASARPAGAQCLQVRPSVLKTLRRGLRAQRFARNCDQRAP